MNLNQKITLPSWKKTLGIAFVVVVFLSFFGIFNSVENEKRIENNPPVSEEQKQLARQHLEKLLSSGKELGVINSYEFPDGQKWVIYVEKSWYSETVSDKREFMGQIGFFVKEITGFNLFEVRDAYSNEKVAEAKGIYGVEIYK